MSSVHSFVIKYIIHQQTSDRQFSASVKLHPQQLERYHINSRINIPIVFDLLHLHVHLVDFVLHTRYLMWSGDAAVISRGKATRYQIIKPVFGGQTQKLIPAI